MGYESTHRGKFVQRLASMHREAPGVSFSTDFMTPQQIKEMSGPVHIYYIGEEDSHELKTTGGTLASMASNL